jgi:hypothetical protein
MFSGAGCVGFIRRAASTHPSVPGPLAARLIVTPCDYPAAGAGPIGIVLGWHAQQHVDVVRHGVALQNLDLLLSAKLPKNPSYLPPSTSKKLPLPVLWQSHHVELAVPPHMGLATPIFHRRSSPSLGAFLRGGSFHLLAGNGRADALFTARGGGLPLI